MSKYDLIILGGGPAGYMAAIHAAQKDLNVVLIEGDRLGGTCLNRGCIPTKAMIEGVSLWSGAKNAAAFGMVLEQKEASLAKLVDWKDQVVANLCRGVEQLMQGNGIKVINGFGEITSTGGTKEVLIDGEKTVTADNILIATGSTVSYPPLAGLREAKPLISDTILDLRELPKSLIIIGAGVIGLEMATIYNSLGVEITVLELEDQVLPGLDNEIARRLKTFLKKRGISVETGARAQKITGVSGNEVIINYEQKKKEKSMKAQSVLVATGRKPLLKGMPKAEGKNVLEVNSFLETTWPGIYGAGDVIGGYYLAHVAYQEGILAVDNILGAGKEVDYRGVPACIFTDPQVAITGSSEEELKEKGVAYSCFKFPYNALGKAVATNNTEGMVKIMTNAGGNKVLGMHIIGREASELIHHAATAIRLEISPAQLADTIFAHPTFSEALGEVYHMSRGHYYHLMKR